MFTFKNGDTLQLKNIQYAEFASEETHCFEASVYFNNTLIGTVSNEGRGGANRFEPYAKFGSGYINISALDNPSDYAQEYGKNNRLWAGLDTRIKEEHPKHYIEWDDSYNDTSLEVWVSEQVFLWLCEKDYKKLIKSKIVYTEPQSDKPDAVYTMGLKGVRKINEHHIAWAKAKHKDWSILNDMPMDEAIKIFAKA